MYDDIEHEPHTHRCAIIKRLDDLANREIEVGSSTEAFELMTQYATSSQKLSTLVDQYAGTNSLYILNTLTFLLRKRLWSEDPALLFRNACRVVRLCRASINYETFGMLHDLIFSGVDETSGKGVIESEVGKRLLELAGEFATQRGLASIELFAGTLERLVLTDPPLLDLTDPERKSIAERLRSCRLAASALQGNSITLTMIDRTLGQLQASASPPP